MSALLSSVPGDWRPIPMLDDALLTSDLTSKLTHGLSTVRKLRNGPVAFVGMDSPHLSPSEVSLSLFLSASENASYIKPARDGGYLLLSLPDGVGGDVFKGVEWSCEVTFATQVR